MKTHNLVSFFDAHHPSDSYFQANYAGKEILLTHGIKTISAIIADTCADSDCSDCCTKNAGSGGYLVDMEYYTVINNFGSTSVADGTIKFQI